MTAAPDWVRRFFMPDDSLTKGELARYSLFIRNFALRKTINFNTQWTS